MESRQESSTTPPSARALGWWLPVVAALLVIGLHLGVGTVGPRPDWVLFLGRFHPLLVHVPIGLLVVVALAEALSWWPAPRRRFDPVTTPLLVGLVVSGVGAFTLGVLLASDGGYPAHLATSHRMLTLAGVVGSGLALAAWSNYRAREVGAYRHAYRAALILTVVVLGGGAHYGGSMTHGEDYLVRYAPGPLQRWLRTTPEPQVSPAVQSAAAGRSARVFADLVQPALEAHCAECHGDSKTKGGFSVLGLEALLAGGESGPAIVPGAPAESLLLQRLQLPPGHEERMPPAGKPAPTAAEIALLDWWIRRGADPEMTVEEVLPPAPVRQLLEQAVPRAPGPAPPAVTSKPEEGVVGRAVLDVASTRESGAGVSPEAATEEASPRAVEVAVGRSGRVYADHVAPVLEAYCGDCHGSAKQKGQLRTDSLGALRRGGRSGPALIPGSSAASPMVVRLRLPADDDDHMPPPQRPQPTAAEIALVAFWVDRGATEQLPIGSLPRVLAGVPGPARPAPPEPAESHAEAPVSEASEAAAAELSRWTAPPGAVEALGPPAELPLRVALYDEVVAPVLDLRCGACHLGEPLMGGYSIADPGALVASGSIVPGQPEQSELFRRLVLPLDHEDHMPPPKADQPTVAELALLQYWIEMGAHHDGAVATADLPPLVAHVVAEHAAAEAFASEPPRSPSVSRQDSAPGPRRAGCAACTIGAEPKPARFSFLAGVLAVAIGLARRRTRRKAS